MKRILKTSFLLAFSTVTLIANEPETVKLVPPILTRETISEEIACMRPMRDGKFNISVEQRSGKTVVNCYGHGGAGWSTLFGSVKQAVELFEKDHPNKDVPIRIIGSGCMGLTTAIELDRLGYSVAGISTKSLDDNPSWRAPGQFALVSLKTSAEEQANLNEIGLTTFQTYQVIDRGEHSYIANDAVRYMPIYCSMDADPGLEYLEMQGIIPPRQNVSLDFGNGAIHHGFVKYMTYFMDTAKLMKQLSAEVNRREIPIKIQDVGSYDEISEEIIFNCSGLGGRILNEDENLVAVRGHLITLKEAAGEGHMDYMIYAKVEQGGKEEYIYLSPKTVSVLPENPEGTSCAGILGGTFIPNTDKRCPCEISVLDHNEFQRLLDRNSKFFQGHSFGE